MIKKILVPVGFSQNTSKIINQTIELAKQMQAEVEILYIQKYEPEIAGYISSSKKHYDEATLDEIKKLKNQFDLESLRNHFLKENIKIKIHLSQGYLASEIINHAEKLKSDLIIMGSHGHGIIHDLLLGSISHNVINNSPCPVFIIPLKE